MYYDPHLMRLATTPGHCMARCSAAWPPLVMMFTTLPSCRRIFSTAATSPCENIYSHIKIFVWLLSVTLRAAMWRRL